MEVGTIEQALEATMNLANSISVPIELMESVGLPLLAIRKNLQMVLESIRNTEEPEKKEAQE